MRLFSFKHSSSTKLLMLWNRCFWSVASATTGLHGFSSAWDATGGPSLQHAGWSWRPQKLLAKEAHTIYSLLWKHKESQHNEKSLWEGGQPGIFNNKTFNASRDPCCDFRKSFPQRSQVSISKSLLVGKQPSRAYRQPYNELVLLHELWKESFALSQSTIGCHKMLIFEYLLIRPSRSHHCGWPLTYAQQLHAASCRFALLWTKRSQPRIREFETESSLRAQFDLA